MVVALTWSCPGRVDLDRSNRAALTQPVGAERESVKICFIFTPSWGMLGK